MKPGRRYRALGWVGGKSAHGAHKTGLWIAGLLPPPTETYAYVEPFCGMLGVLLQREPARREIANDMDTDLVNWWRVVRDFPERLGDKLDWTPGWSAQMFGEAVARINQPVEINDLSDDESVERAYDFTLVVAWVRGNMIGRVRSSAVDVDAAAERNAVGKHQRDTAQFSERERPADDGIKRWKETRWEKDDTARRLDDGIIRAKDTRAERWEKAMEHRAADVNLKRYALERERYRYRRPAGRAVGELAPPRSQHIIQLAERVREIELEIRPAEWMVEYYGDNPNITWYLDPPYQIAAEKGLYTHNDLNIADWIPRLQTIRGLAAISGYNTEWDGLGWMRHEHFTHGSVGAQHDRERPEKTEVLWTNYDPADYNPAPALF